jgi:hypothetical protein
METRQLSKHEIDLLMDIRRCIKKELGVVLRLSSPTLFSDLVELWHQSRDAITKSKIRKFFDRIGGEWPSRLKQRPRAMDS